MKALLSRHKKKKDKKKQTAVKSASEMESSRMVSAVLEWLLDMDAGEPVTVSRTRKNVSRVVWFAPLLAGS
jgi:hypothetical protein